jgi:hypothetical protein
MSSTCFEQPSVHPQEELYMQFYGISFMHPYTQSGRSQDVFDALNTNPSVNRDQTRVPPEYSHE